MNQQSRFARLAGIAAALVASLALAVPAHADPLKCQQEITKDTSKYVQARTKALQKCHEAIVKGKIPPQDCLLEPTAAGKIVKADSKLRAGVNKKCGGADKTCSTAGDNDSLASIGWPSTCPSFEGSCNNAITTCGDINDCLICVGNAAVDQSISLSYDDLVPSTPGSDANKCQVAIGKNAAKFLSAKSKALSKCEGGVLKGTVTGPCPDALKAVPAINKAESKKIAGICKACGGADKICGNGDDQTVGAIGFATTCPNVTIPGGFSCKGAVNSLQNLVDCVDCVNEFKADCLDPLSIPSQRTYPAECVTNPNPPPCDSTPQNTATPCPTATPGIVCPTLVRTDANGPGVDLDTGWTGQSHDGHAPSNNRLTLAISACSNPDASTCGVCNTSGPLPNAGGASLNTHRCVLDTRFACTSDPDCTGLHCSGGTNSGAACTVNSQCPIGSCAAGPGGTCSFFFGGPLPLSAGGVSVCVSNQMTTPITGTVDVEGGTTESNINLLSRVFIGPTLDHPCPNCIEELGHPGVCDSGPHGGENCIVMGHSDEFGDVSFDCPPLGGANVGNLPIPLDYTTGVQTRTLSAANPNCRAPGTTSDRCFCDTCNNAAASPCATNADCVLVGATICGGRRCVGGTNVGAACVAASECPGGGCVIPGTQTAPNQCDDLICSPTSTCVGGCNAFLNCTGAFGCVGGANDGALCTVASECPGGSCDEQCPGGSCVTGNEGVCAAGPLEKFCNLQRFRGCGTDADCPAPGDTCAFEKFRDCFLDNGAIGGSVTVSGVPYPSCGGVGTGTVGALFCVPPTSSSSINNVSGLPGLGRVSLPYTATFQ
ncbi:MAG TPA: hypothetical protein VGK30_04005 [Candidatus Binatia bacterium]|jgi:hypothetical protein